MPESQFEFDAQSQTGASLRGTLPASDLDAARLALLEAGLTPSRLDRVSLGERLHRPLSIDDLLQFNTQLSHLASAGMPMEAGLQLIARDLGRGRLAQAIAKLALETQSGLSLSDAFAKHRSQFPPMYAGLIDAGIRSSNLPAVLAHLGQQLQLMSELRSTLWRTLTYPVLVLLSVLGLAMFVGWRVVPQIQSVVDPLMGTPTYSFQKGVRITPDRPFVLEIALWALHVLPYIALAALCVVLAFLAAMTLARIIGQQPRFRDAVLLRVPLLGRIFCDAALAQYAGVTQIGVVAGLDLPGALDIADRASGSPRLHADTLRIIDRLSAGQPLVDSPRLSLVPPTLLTSIDLATQRGQLDRALGALAALYRRTAMQRVRRLPLIITPVLMLVIAGIVLLVTLSLVIPMLNITRFLV